MSTFNEREKAFEDKFKHDEELAFRVAARRNKMLGLWAAEQMGITGSAAEDYAKSVIREDLKEAGSEDVVRKISADFAEKGVSLSDDKIRREILHFEATAREQIMKE